MLGALKIYSPFYMPFHLVLELVFLYVSLNRTQVLSPGYEGVMWEEI